MSKRLQVLLGEEEFGELRATAHRQGMTVSEWVRHLIREGTRQADTGDAARKLEIIRKASEYAFPAGDIDTMLAEIEQGYSAEEH
jgi:hypothetical protein